MGGVGFVLVGFIREGTGPLSCYHVILVVPVNVLAFVYIGREGRPLWELVPFLKSIAIVLSRSCTYGKLERGETRTGNTLNG